MPERAADIVQEILAPALTEAGFERMRSSWYKDTKESVLVVNVQSSRWVNAAYINLGVYFRQLGSKRGPREEYCHVRERLSSISDSPMRGQELLDFTNLVKEVTLAERRAELPPMLVKYGFAWLDANSTIEGARHMIKTGRRPGIHPDAFDVLGVEPPD